MRRSIPSVLLMGCLLFLASCGGGGATSISTKNDLQALGLAYHEFHQKNKHGPKDADDLQPFIDKNSPKAYSGLKDGTYVFIWNVAINDMLPTSDTVLAYHKETPDKGGFALYGDATTRQLSAAEFKNAKLAKAK